MHFDGSELIAGALSENPPPLDINKNADAANCLAVKSDAELLNHDDVTLGSGDARKIINKAEHANVAPPALFQRNFVG